MIIYQVVGQVVGIQHVFVIFKKLTKVKKSKPFSFDVFTCVFFKNICLIHPITHKYIKLLHQLQSMIN